MAEEDGIEERNGSARAFMLMMWAYLFFLPVPVDWWQPSIGGWILLLLGLRSLGPGERRLRPLVLVAIVGIVVWTCDAFLPAAKQSDSVAWWLMVCRWALLAGASWWLCGFVAGLARRRGAEALATSAAWRRWTVATAFVLLAGSLLVPARFQIYYGWAFLLAAMVAITAMMSLMIGTVRLLSVPSAPAPSAEPAEAE